MNTIQIIQILFGLPIALFLPGYLLVRILFKKFGILEKLLLGFFFSFMIDLALALYLGYNKTMKNLTGGITAYNLWFYLGTLTVALFIIWIIVRPEELKASINFFKKLFERHN